MKSLQTNLCVNVHAHTVHTVFIYSNVITKLVKARTLHHRH